MPGEVHSNKLVDNLIELFKAIGYDYPVYYFEMFMQHTKDTYQIYPKDECKIYCDIAFYYPQTKRHLIGVEVKDWQKSVPLSVIKKEYYSYRDTFDLFYLVANKFTKETIFLLECSSDAKEVANAKFLSNVGLIQMGNKFNLNLLKKATELNPNDIFKGDFLRRLRNNFGNKDYDKRERLEKKLETYGTI